jgi:glycosyltransferase involved in cell wall biosynthesis
VSKRVLHVLSQRPGRTGSGVTLDAFVRGATNSGWDQHVVVGTPANESVPEVGGLPAERIHPLVFETGELDFPLPGMSDVMPYASSRFSSLTSAQLETYRTTWKKHLTEVIALTKPDLIHSHHLWIVSSLIKEIAPNIPVVTSCHATGLRQLELCPHLAEDVQIGCKKLDRIVSLQNGHISVIHNIFDVPTSHIKVVGGGFNANVFHNRGRGIPAGKQIVYAGKLSQSKGLPWLLEAFARISDKQNDVTLHIAGSGVGPEADALRERMSELSPAVVAHGQIDQPTLAELMRQSAVFVLPSLYEGLALVVVEAAACGCRIVSTELTGVMDQFAKPLAEAIDLVAMPEMQSVDVPLPDERPAFVDRLETALNSALAKPAIESVENLIGQFTWNAVFSRVETVWNELLGESR